MKFIPWQPFKIVCHEVSYIYEMQIDVAMKLDDLIYYYMYMHRV